MASHADSFHWIRLKLYMVPCVAQEVEQVEERYLSSFLSSACADCLEQIWSSKSTKEAKKPMPSSNNSTTE